MTSHELARKLLALPDQEVRMAQPSGNYWGSVWASHVVWVEPRQVIPYGDGQKRLLTADDIARDERDGQAYDYERVLTIG